MAQYAWVCDLCEAAFEPTGAGHAEIQIHIRDEHDAKPGGGNCRGLVDVETGEVIIPGWGPRVLGKARKEGYVPPKDDEGPLSREDADGGNEADNVVDLVDLKEAKRQKAGGKSTRTTYGVPRMSVLADNLRLDPIIHTLFQVIVELHRDKYPDFSPETESIVIRDYFLTSCIEEGLLGDKGLAVLLANSFGLEVPEGEEEEP